MKKTMILFAALAFGLYSCDKGPGADSPDGGNADPVEITVNATIPDLTGADGFGFKWSVGDGIGLFDDAGASSVKEFVLETGAGQSSGDFVGKLVDDEASPRKIYAVSPFDTYVQNATADAYPLAISTNQTSLNRYLFMAGATSISEAPSKATVEFDFRHLMAILKVKVTGIPAGRNLNAVRIEAADGSAPFATKATVDLTASTPAAANFSDKVAGIAVSAPGGTTGSYEADIVMFPIDFSSAPQDLRISVSADNGKDYAFELVGFNKNLAAGTVTTENAAIVEFGEGGFEFAATETARPGEGEWADFDIVPIRGEVLNSKDDMTPYVFTLGKDATNGRQLRIWFVSKKGTEIGEYFALNRFGANSDVMGFDPAHIAEVGGEGSSFAGGNASKSWKETGYYFLNEADADKYNISYTLFNVLNTSRFTTPATESFTIYGYLGNTSVNDTQKPNEIPYTDVKFPVTIDTQEDTSSMEVFTPAVGETARPGVGEYASSDIIAIRGEFINSNDLTDVSVYQPIANTSFVAKKGFRMWFIAKKEYAGGDMLKLRHDLPVGAGASYFKGTLKAEVETICGAGSQLGGGNLSRSYKQVPCTFASSADNSLYTISYAYWNTDQANIVTGAAGEYVVPFYILPDATNGIPQEMTCNVKVKTVAAE